MNIVAMVKDALYRIEALEGKLVAMGEDVVHRIEALEAKTLSKMEPEQVSESSDSSTD